MKVIKTEIYDQISKSCPHHFVINLRKENTGGVCCKLCNAQFRSLCILRVDKDRRKSIFFNESILFKHHYVCNCVEAIGHPLISRSWIRMDANNKKDHVLKTQTNGQTTRNRRTINYWYFGLLSPLNTYLPVVLVFMLAWRFTFQNLRTIKPICVRQPANVKFFEIFEQQLNHCDQTLHRCTHT